LPLHGPNQWPADCPWLRTASEAYFEQAQALGLRLLKVCAASLDMPEDHFLQYCTKRWCRCGCSTIRRNRRSATRRLFGVAPHTDYSGAKQLHIPARSPD